MRAVRLAAIAVQAEQLRWRHRLRRRLYQGGLLMLACLMMLLAVLIGEMSLYALLAARLPPAGAAGCLAGANAVVGLVLAGVSINSTPGEAEREAAILAGAAVEQIRQSFSWMRLVLMLVARVTGSARPRR